MKYLNRENYNPHWLLANTNGNTFENVSDFSDVSVSDSLKQDNILIFRLLSNKRVRKLVDFDRLLFIREPYRMVGDGFTVFHYPSNSLGRVNSRDFNTFVRETIFSLLAAIKQATGDKFIAIKLDYTVHSARVCEGFYQKPYTDFSGNIFLCSSDSMLNAYLRKMYIDIALVEL